MTDADDTKLVAGGNVTTPMSLHPTQVRRDLRIHAISNMAFGGLLILAGTGVLLFGRNLLTAFNALAPLPSNASLLPWVGVPLCMLGVGYLVRGLTPRL